MTLTCLHCDAVYDPREARFRCDCGGPLDVSHPLEGLQVDRARFSERLGSLRAPGRSGVWRYRELIAEIPPEHIVSMGEGNTNLHRDERLSAWTGCEALWLKHEGENPTGSFKDRGMTVGISHARWVGAKTVACASTGNTSAAVSAYAAAAGLRALTFVPEGKLAVGKLAQTIAYGARTVQVRGDFDAAMDLVQQVARQHGVYLLNSLNPFRLEGQKAIILEALQQLDWAAPDWIALPGGNLGNCSAFGKALHEAKELGLIDRMPRLAVIQAAGANPFYRAFACGFARFVPVQAETVATAIRIGNPVNVDKARRAIEWTDGIVEEVTDEEIMEAKRRIDGAGIGCEPASAASIAGVRRLVERGVIRTSDVTVAILTGHILKDPEAILRDQVEGGRNRPVTVEPNLEAVEELLRE